MGVPDCFAPPSRYYVQVSGKFFAGHRRPLDIQHRIELRAQALCLATVVLSIDVLHGDHHDMGSEANISFWISLVEQGRVVFIVAEPPCESWCPARNKPLVGEKSDGPAPLRS